MSDSSDATVTHLRGRDEDKDKEIEMKGIRRLAQQERAKVDIIGAFGTKEANPKAVLVPTVLKRAFLK